MRTPVLLTCLAAVLASIAACKTTEDKPLLVATDPGKVFLDDLELHLLRAHTAHIQAHATSSDAVNSDVNVELFLGEGQRARLTVQGTFEGRPVDALFTCDGTRMHVRGQKAEPAAPEVRDALVLGFVRMGILHNAATLIGGRAPDHAAGNVHNWVRSERARSGEPATEVSFDVVIRDQVMGDALLKIDESARPVERAQTVHFEEGDVNVKETYSAFELDVPLDRSAAGGVVDEVLFGAPPAPPPPPPPPAPAVESAPVSPDAPAPPQG
jgi:hypothetical protein